MLVITSVYVLHAVVLNALLVHAFALDGMVSCTLIPIPKSQNGIVARILVTYYRGIALSSSFGKVKFYDCLCTSERQFG